MSDKELAQTERMNLLIDFYGVLLTEKQPDHTELLLSRGLFALGNRRVAKETSRGAVTIF